LLENDPAVSDLLATLSRNVQDLPTPAYTGPEYLENIERMNDALDALEELLLERMSLMDQAQRLKRTPPEDLPPQFKEMAARYFEALSKEQGNDKSDADDKKE